MANYLNSTARAHLRLRFTEGVKAELRLMNNHGELLTNATSTVLLLNMSQSGLCFLSNLQLPIQSNYLVEFRMYISNIPLTVHGSIVWCSAQDNQYAHGVVLHCSNMIRRLLLRIMNQELLKQQPQQLKIHHMYRRLIQKKRKLYEYEG